jgi:diguanylate cyclase (GGDEF)-like protein
MLRNMFWLNSVSNAIALLACGLTVISVTVSMQRPRTARLAWQGWALPVMMLAAASCLEAADVTSGAAQLALGLAGRLLFLGAACLVWPLLSTFMAASHLNAKVHAQTQSRLDLARAEATQSWHWMQLAEKIARVGHWRYTVADQRLTWSDEMFTIFGLEPAGFRPNLDFFLSVLAPEDRARASADFHKALVGADAFEFTVKICQEGRPAVHVTARGIPELDDAGHVAALFGVLVDVTAQKQVEEGLKNAHQASEVANKALDALARHDALTLIPNRRHFDEMIAMEFRRAAREMQPIGLIMIDLDHFKAYNDHYGHPMGDECLRVVAAAITSVPQRPADMVARYGGEEIVVLLPNTDLPGAKAVADLIVGAVRDLQMPHAGNAEGIVTVSCGAAAFEPAKDPCIVVTLIERADQALYEAKRSGRNRAAVCDMAA